MLEPLQPQYTQGNTQPLLPQPDCWPSLTLRNAIHAPGGLFCWLTILRKQWDWILCLPSSSSWADSMETAYVCQERILNKSKISALWFCLYCSSRHTSDFTVVPDSRLARMAPNWGEDWEPLVICPRHLPEDMVQLHPCYGLQKREGKGRTQTASWDTWMPCMWCLWNRVQLRADTWDESSLEVAWNMIHY